MHTYRLAEHLRGILLAIYDAIPENILFPHRYGRSVKIGFFVNPVAGLGLSTNLKGSDGLVIHSRDESSSVKKAMAFLRGVKRLGLHFYVPSGIMGSDLMDDAGISDYTVIHEPAGTTTAKDTMDFVEALNKTDARILAFVGGDGTARDILSSGCRDLVMIGIPAGMKMYSSVFSISVEASVQLMEELCSAGTWETGKYDVVDIDEEKYRRGELDISMFGEMNVPLSPYVVSNTKAEYTHVDVSGVKEYIEEKLEEGTCYIIGPGTTCKSVMPALDGRTNILGFDIIMDGRLLREDADEEAMADYSSRYRTVLIISPVGGQNFLLGRGNRQASARVIGNIGWKNIWVVSSREKLDRMPNLFVDIGNSPDIKIPGFIKVLYGYGRFRMVPVKR